MDTGSDDVDTTTRGDDATVTQLDGGPRTDGDRGVESPNRGEMLGRFVVTDRLGAGAMGVVLAGYDPDLDRKVAIKLLRPDVFRGQSEGARARLLREAQAMAKLSHANVVTVHEVGFSDGRLFVAMELVDGGTLRDAIGEDRPWREVLRKVLDAGSGLAAAHRAGLVHRDFKPDNVLVDREGRVKVTDFGLVALAEEGGIESGGAETSGELRRLASTLTRTGAIMGTPAYMAPEQHKGGGAGRRSDQFAFCVTLYEALYGRRPFVSPDLPGLVHAVTNGELAPTPPGRRVPRWLRRIALRGLSSDPGERWPSMDALLDAIEDGLGQRRRRANFVALGAVGGAGLGLFAWQANSHSAATCATDERLAAAWDDARRDAVHGAFVDTGRSYAEDTYARVRAGLDGYAQAWAELHEEICRAKRAGASESDALLDRKMMCLDRGLARLDALTSQLSDPQGNVIDRAVRAVAALPPVSRCRDVEGLLADVPMPSDPAARASIGVLQTELAEAETMVRLGRYPEATEALAGIADASEAWPWIQAEALELRGRLQFQSGDPASAEQTLQRAVEVASKAGRTTVEARAWIGLVHTVGQMKLEHERALGLAEAARMAALRAKDDSLRPTLLSALGGLHKLRGEHEEALSNFEAALDSATQMIGNGSFAAGMAANNVATVHDALGQYDQAQEYYARALDIWETSLGSGHPMVAGVLNNRGLVRMEQGDYDGAQKDFEASLGIRTEAFGAGHPRTVNALNNLGTLQLYRGDLARAQSYYERAYEAASKRPGDVDMSASGALENLAIVHRQAGRLDVAREKLEQALEMRQEALGERHHKVAEVQANIAWLLHGEERYEEALKLHREVLAVQRESFAEDHPTVAMTRNAIAVALAALDRCEEAVPEYRRALKDSAAAMGADHPRLAEPRAALGECLVEIGQTETGIAELERALKTINDAGITGQVPIRARFALARGLWAQGETERARALASEAAALLPADPIDPETTRIGERLETWRGEH